MAKKRKKIRVRWGRLAIVVGVFAALVFGFVMLVRGVLSLFDTAEDGEADEITQVVATPEMLRCDSVMARRVDSLFHVPQRLDTAKIAVSLYDATSGQVVYRRHATDSLAPASCMKVATALSALKMLGFDHRYCESLQVKGRMVGDTLKGNLLLRADADPLLESFDDLVKQLRRRGVRYVDGNVYLCLEKEDTLRAHPTAKTWDIPYHKLPPLLKGKRYVERTLLYTLHLNGIGYRHNAKVKPEGKYRVVAQSSHLMRDVITPMLIHSSNIKADALMWHMDSKLGIITANRQQWGVRHAIGMWIEQTFAGICPQIGSFVVNDGSGLSPKNRLNADFLVELLKYAYKDRHIKDYFVNEALATPGYGERRGSLLTRLSRQEYRDRIFVKTGTLTTIGTSSLAGYVVGNDGHWYIFSIINSDSPVAESRMFQDRLCRELLK